MGDSGKATLPGGGTSVPGVDAMGGEVAGGGAGLPGGGAVVPGGACGSGPRRRRERAAKEVEGSGASAPGGGTSAAGVRPGVPGVDAMGGKEVPCGGPGVPGGGPSAAGTGAPGNGASAAGIRTTVPGIDSLGEVGRRSPKNAITRPGSTMPLAPPLAVAGAVYDDIVGAYRGFMPSRTRAFLVIHRGPLEPHVRCPYCGARVWSMTAAGLARLSSSSSSDGERSADSDSNHSDDESFAAADIILRILPSTGLAYEIHT
ncbi:hypothetical protein OsI_36903 [Oryza sativa Indica Group]|uniref:Uncharacterized protein n=1 Tax=Oryza sativa subsp. indica TaxID=39946 RepID=B8BLN9_ORYSI|nr:hypothetical protein OsI_36903 [Oryza sativa Indica Group]